MLRKVKHLNVTQRSRKREMSRNEEIFGKMRIRCGCNGHTKFVGSLSGGEDLWRNVVSGSHNADVLLFTTAGRLEAEILEESEQRSEKKWVHFPILSLRCVFSSWFTVETHNLRSMSATWTSQTVWMCQYLANTRSAVENIVLVKKKLHIYNYFNF